MHLVTSLPGTNDGKATDTETETETETGKRASRVGQILSRRARHRRYIPYLSLSVKVKRLLSHASSQTTFSKALLLEAPWARLGALGFVPVASLQPPAVPIVWSLP
jgi:hypothetical protein